MLSPGLSNWTSSQRGVESSRLPRLTRSSSGSQKGASSEEECKASRVTLCGREVFGSQKDAEWLGGRRVTKRAKRNRCRLRSKMTSSGQRGDEQPGRHRMAKRVRNIGRWLVGGRAMSGQETEKPGGCLVTGKAPSLAMTFGRIFI